MSGKQQGSQLAWSGGSEEEWQMKLRSWGRLVIQSMLGTHCRVSAEGQNELTYNSTSGVM